MGTRKGLFECRSLHLTEKVLAGGQLRLASDIQCNLITASAIHLLDFSNLVLPGLLGLLELVGLGIELVLLFHQKVVELLQRSGFLLQLDLQVLKLLLNTCSQRLLNVGQISAYHSIDVLCDVAQTGIIHSCGIMAPLGPIKRLQLVHHFGFAWRAKQSQ